ncbi:MAG: type II toxin-antitoxin system VapB family antitoxin [Thermomicrobiales bacterium]
MALTITDPDLIALIRRRTRETGLSIEETLEQALTQPLPERHHAEESRPLTPLTHEEAQARHDRILALLDRIGAQMDPDLSRERIDDLLYDEHGLPR